MKRSELIFSIILVPLDFLMLMLAGIAAYLMRTKIISIYRPVRFDLNLPLERYIVLVLIMTLVFMMMYALSGLYRLKATRSTLQEFARVVIASSAGIMAVIVAIFLRQELFDSRFLVLGSWLFAIILVTLGRFFARILQRALVSRRDFGIHRVLVVGADSVSRKIISGIKNNPWLGYRIVKQLNNPEIEEVDRAIENPGIDEVILADPNYPKEKIIQLLGLCNDKHIVFKFVPNIYQTLTTNFAFDVLIGVPVIELQRTALHGWGQVIKRLVDIIGSLVGLIIAIPFSIIVATAIKINSRGPILVRLERISKNKPFKLYKFRSMIDNAETYKKQLIHLNERNDGPLFKIKNDPRVTTIGRVLRKYRLDEFPQLINVLKGEISLVGPRPHQPDEIARYQKHHRQVLAIKAGVTGMAQISGSSDLSFEDEVALDSFYIEHWSFWQDIKIILLTLAKVFRDPAAV